MKYRLEIPPDLQVKLDVLRPEVRFALYDGLILAAYALGASGGTNARGDRVPDLLPPMYILRSHGYRLLYEVDAAARALLVRSLAAPASGEPERREGG